MINSELSHNPYLLLTEVKFNGQKPRINSQIEKYEHLPLKDWVHMVPDIFYNEMNGYDFELYFTGTKPDFDEVRKAFELAGVSSEQVNLFHKNELEDADTKNAEIDALLVWLEDNPNRKFDYNAFREEYSELFESSYPYIIVRGSIPESLPSYISAESVKNAQELCSTVLTSTPVIFYIDEESTGLFRQDLLTLLSRHDIRQEQLFFMIHSMMNVGQVTRVITDLGVKKPQVIDTYDAESVMRYFRNYPITEYVREAIKVFSTAVENISTILEVENSESEITNAGIHAEIESLELELQSLKEADDFFVQRNNYNTVSIFQEAHYILEDQIRKWKNRKTKVTGDYEIEVAAEDYECNLRKYIDGFVANVNSAYRMAQENIWTELSGIYSKPDIDAGFRPVGLVLSDCKDIIFPKIKAELLDLKEVTYVEAKNNFFGLFKKQVDENVEMIRVVTCYYEKWRLKVLGLLMPLADDVIKACAESLQKYYDDLSSAYHIHLIELISEKAKEKEQVAARLSDDERKLQEDNDWLAEFRNRLQAIESPAKKCQEVM